MGYLFTNDHDFLLKVIDCYYKKTYLQPKEENDDDFINKQSKDFFDYFKKKFTKQYEEKTEINVSEIDKGKLV